MFKIPTINPLKFPDNEGIKFDRLKSIETFNRYQREIVYYQKWQRDDITRLQILTDAETFTFDLRECEFGISVLNVVPIEQETSVINQDFKIFEVPINFSTVPDGRYYAEITYVDELEQNIVLQSEPIEVKEKHPETVLIEYLNTDNQFSVVFDTGIVFTLRVEGLIDGFTPLSEDVAYNDQKKRNTLLNSVPYRSFVFYVGNAAGLPWWICEKINFAFSCNIKKLDGDLYEKVEGTAWEVKREDQYKFIGLEIEIMPVSNRFLEAYLTGQKNPGSVTIVNKKLEYDNISGNFNIVGKFNGRSVLEKIVIYKTGADFNLKLGITDGGGEIIESILVDESVKTILVNFAFEAEVTVYVAGVVDVTAMFFLYDQLNEPSIPVGLNPGTGETTGSLGVGAQIIYHYNDPAQLDQDFDVVSGLGRENGGFPEWAICDGRNGTPNMSGLLPYGVDGEIEINQAVGSDEIEIKPENLPEHSHFIASEEITDTTNLTNQNHMSIRRNAGGNYKYALSDSQVEPTVGLTSKSGQEIPEKITNMPKGIGVLWIKKIA